MRAASVGGNHAGLPSQNIVSQTGKRRARPDFNKQPDAIDVHPLDHLAKAHRLGQLLRQQFPASRGLIGIRRCGHVGVDRNLQRFKRLLIQKLLKFNGGRGHIMRMKSRSDLQSFKSDFLLRQMTFKSFDVVNRPGHHRLFGTVVVGNNDGRCRFQNQAGNVGIIGNHGSHRPAGAEVFGGVGHQLPALAGQQNQFIGRGKRAGRIQSRKFAKAVPGGAIGPDAHFAQQRRQRQAHRADGRLSPLRLRQFVLLTGFIFRRKNRLRINDFVQFSGGLAGLKSQIGGLIPHVSGGVKFRHQSAAHIHILTALTGVQKGDFAAECARLIEYFFAAGKGGAGVLVDLVKSLLEQRGGLFAGSGNDAETNRCRCLKGQLRRPGAGGQGIAGQLRQNAVRRLLESGGVFRADEQGLDRRVVQSPGLPAIFFQRQMEIAAAKAKRTDGGLARRLRRMNPRPSLRIQIKRGCFDF